MVLVGALHNDVGDSFVTDGDIVSSTSRVPSSQLPFSRKNLTVQVPKMFLDLFNWPIIELAFSKIGRGTCTFHCSIEVYTS
jgi:hypothetical protein